MHQVRHAGMQIYIFMTSNMMCTNYVPCVTLSVRLERSTTGTYMQLIRPVRVCIFVVFDYISDDYCQLFYIYA